MSEQKTIYEFDLQNVHYKIVDTLYFGEVSFIRKSGRHLIGLSDRIKQLGGLEESKFSEEITKISVEIMGKADETDESVLEALVRCYGLDIPTVKKLHYLDAAFLFSELFRESTTPKKKLATPSILPSSSDPQTTQQ